jgi:hypothetical protein
VRPDEFLKYDFDELEEICHKSTRVRKNAKKGGKK